MADPIFGQNEDAPGITPGAKGVGSVPNVPKPMGFDTGEADTAAAPKPMGFEGQEETEIEFEPEDHPASVFDRLSDGFMSGLQNVNESVYGILGWMSDQMEAGGLSDGPPVDFKELSKRAAQEQEDIAFQPSVGMEELLSDPTKFVTTTAGLEYISQSVPEMMLAMMSLGGYATIKTDMMARDRSENDGRGEPGFLDYAAAAPYAAGSAYMERFALKFALKNTGAKSLAEGARKVAESATIGASTEIAQELLEYTGEHLGTKKGADPMDAVAQASFAAYLGGLTEGGINTASQTGGSLLAKAANASQAQYKAIQMKRLANELRHLDSDHKLVAQENFAEKLRNNDIQEVFVDYDVLNEWLEANGGDVLAASLNLEENLEKAEATQGMVPIQVDDLIKNFTDNENFDGLVDHLLFDASGVTGAEAKEYFKGDVDLDFRTEPETAIAEQEMIDLGLDGMVKSADEAGMTSKEWTAYQNAKEEHRTATKKTKEEMKAARAVNKNAKKISKLRKEEAARAKEELRDAPEYASQEYVDEGNKLDRGLTMQVLDTLGMELSDLPKTGRKVKYTSVSQNGTDPTMIAAMHGYNSAQDMFVAWAQYPDINQRANQVAQERVKDRSPSLFTDRKTLHEERRAAYGVETINLLEKELEVAEKFAGQQPAKRNRFVELKKNARALVKSFTIKELNVNSFLNQATRSGHKAGVAWRKGDYRTALKWKYRQLVNSHLARLVPEIRAQAEKDVKYAKKFINKKDRFVPGLVDMQEEVINESDWFGGKATPYKTWSVDRIHREANKIREIDHKIKEAKKIQDAVAKRNAEMAKRLVEEGLPQKKAGEKTPEQLRTDKSKILKFATEFGVMSLHPDTIVQMVDGDFTGAFRDFIKKPYDDAIAGGYNGKMGQMPRWENTVEQLGDLFDLLPAETKKGFDNPRKVEGVNEPFTNETFIMALLHTGNETNIDALKEQRGFKNSDIKKMYEAATDAELKFAQGVWDLYDSFHQETVESQMRRSNRKVGKVEGRAFMVRGKKYRGGYVPIKAVADGNPLTRGELNVEQEMQRVLHGSEASLHTKDGHTKARQEMRGLGTLRLDLDQVAENLHALVYDLEVGDAMVDIFRVLYSNEVKQSFRDKGQIELWNQLDLFFKDAVAGEKMPVSVLNKVMRRIRQGGSVVALGFRSTVALIQPAGIFNAAPITGVTPVAWNLTKVAGTGFRGANRMANKLSPFMKVRSDAFNKEINEFYRDFKTKKHKVWTDYVLMASFFPIKIMQRWTDLAVFHTYMQQRLKAGDTQAAAIEAAERLVVRSQGSGIWGDRSSFERGSSADGQQSELQRVFSFLMSYHIATNNIIKTKGINEKGMRKAMHFAAALFLAAVPEAFLFGALFGRELPDEPEDVPLFMMKSMAKKYAAGVPLVNNISSAMQGFQGTGPTGTITDTIGSATKEVLKEDTDEAKVALDVFETASILAKFPAGQIRTTIEAIMESSEGKEVEPWEYLFGIPYEEDK